MTGHLLVKSDVYSYGVVLLELLTGRKPVDMSQPVGDENLVVWARPLLKSREGLERLVDPTLAGTYDFDEMAKVAAIASTCVNLEVTRRPFMGEVVQALKLIFNDNDDADYYSQKESSGQESDFRGNLSDSSA
jgi:serine/threonine protein kinase